MLSILRNLLKSRQAEPEGRITDPKVATAALLVEAALTDGIYAAVEQDQIVRVLMDAFDLDRDAAKVILKQAEPETEAAIDAWRFTKQFKTLDYPVRVKVIEGLYRVANADGEACKFEDAFVRHVASLLHVEDVDRAHARNRATEKGSDQ